MKSLLILCFCLLGLVGCRSEPESIDSSIPASQQRVGDAQSGREALITKPIVSCGLPLSIFDQLNRQPAYTFPERQGRAATLSYNVNLIKDENGVDLAASNCLTCHATPLFGELVVGLGNEFLDFTQDPSIAVERAGALLTDNLDIAAWEKYADRIAAIAPYIQTETIGVNPANNLTFALMAQRNPKSMKWLDDPVIATPPEHVLPVSVPPWWRMSKKHAMFSMGEGRGDHASFMMSAAILCTDTVDALKELDKIGPDIRAYIASIKPPPYPFAINADLASTGKDLFEQTCSACHGTYGESPSYPNRLVEIDLIGTDSGLVDFIFGDGQAYVEWFNSSPFGKLARAQPSRGYVAPPLDGIWSTAPFLHNGSVPTVRMLLNSRLRPSVWKHKDRNAESEASYNQNDLGWFISNIGENVPNKNDPWVYDTSKHGYSNSGHTFGDALSEKQRDAVIEYLKTL